MKKLSNIALLILVFFTVIILTLGISYRVLISSVDKNDDKIVLVNISEGLSTIKIGEILKEKNLIRSETIFKIYCKLNNINSLKSGYYELTKSMDLENITKKITKGDTVEPNTITILFKEGINISKIATIIEENTNNTKEDVFNLLNDETYINSLIDKYWFLTNEIKKEDIYYPLEGYLYPNTYKFSNSDVSVEEIFDKLLSETNSILEKYKEQIELSKYTVHELLTIASMSELEGVSLDDRKNISGVFYNRLNRGMSLGSDVTTFYAFKVDMTEKLSSKEYNSYNPYNTRGPKMEGKLPAGPICNSSKEAIESAIIPNENDYYYFVADTNKKVYFSVSAGEQESVINKLRNQGIWGE